MESEKESRTKSLASLAVVLAKLRKDYKVPKKVLVHSIEYLVFYWCITNKAIPKIHPT